MSDLILNLALEFRAPLVGQIAALAVTNAAATADLSGEPGAAGASASIPAINSQQATNVLPVKPSAAVSGSSTSTPAELPKPGFVGHFCTFFADGADVGVVFGPTLASVNGGNAPNLATQGNAGTAGACFRIPSGQALRFAVLGDHRFLGFVGSGNGTLRIAISSR
jgi:hypothetical protein